MKFARLIVTATLTVAASAQTLSFEAYRTKVEPIFLKKRPGHARCYTCHSANSSAFHLQPLAEGKTQWTEAESRLNFESVSHLVTPGNPKTSHFLLHPLAPEAGGDEFHGGGKQFPSQDDPDWKIIADWVRTGK
jgi:hypothetical protein